jgi:hypothetical protein
LEGSCNVFSQSGMGRLYVLGIGTFRSALSRNR